MNNTPSFYAKDRQEWRKWLLENHEKESAVWLVYDKGADRSMSWQDIVKEALCFGWIDSRPGKVSDTQSKIYVSKRKDNSVWSKINKRNVDELIDLGQMTKAGFKSIEIAKKNGSWNALDLSDNLIHPTELKKLFLSDKNAKNNFLSFPIGGQRNSLQWIYDAKTETTREKRALSVFEAAKNNIRIR